MGQIRSSAPEQMNLPRQAGDTIREVSEQLLCGNSKKKGWL
jgi:hypothetical protein